MHLSINKNFITNKNHLTKLIGLISLAITLLILIISTVAQPLGALPGDMMWQKANTGVVGDNLYWHDIASSSDGTKLAAVEEYGDNWNGGSIYTSSDSGLTWTKRTAAGSRYWYSITSSSDGTKLAAVASGGSIYTSTDSGLT